MGHNWTPATEPEMKRFKVHYPTKDGGTDYIECYAYDEGHATTALAHAEAANWDQDSDTLVRFEEV